MKTGEMMGKTEGTLCVDIVDTQGNCAANCVNFCPKVHPGGEGKCDPAGQCRCYFQCQSLSAHRPTEAPVAKPSRPLML